MTTQVKSKKITKGNHDTQATNELIDEYVGKFQLPGWDAQFVAAVRHAAAKQCKATMNVLPGFYTVQEMRHDAVYFIAGFKSGYSYLGSELNRRLLDMD